MATKIYVEIPLSGSKFDLEEACEFATFIEAALDAYGEVSGEFAGRKIKDVTVYKTAKDLFADLEDRRHRSFKMTTAKKLKAMQAVTHIHVEYEPDLREYLAVPDRLEDNSERGILKSLCGRGDTRNEAIDDLFDDMCRATLLVKNATSEDRRHFVWHEQSLKFVGHPQPAVPRDSGARRQ